MNRSTENFIREAWERVPSFSPTVQRVNPVYMTGDSHQLVIARADACSSGCDRVWFQQRAVRHGAGFHIPPQRNEQFPRERDNPNPTEAPTPTAKLRPIPLTEPALLRAPRHRDHLFHAIVITRSIAS